MSAVAVSQLVGLKPLLTPEDAAPFHGLSPRTLRDKALAGEIQHTRAGKKIMFSEEDIKANQAAMRRPAMKPAVLAMHRRARRAA